MCRGWRHCRADGSACKPAMALPVMLALAVLAGCASTRFGDQAPLLSLEGKPPSGQVQMKEVQVAYIGSAGTGEGVLRFRGDSYAFAISGLGVGGIGASTLDARGEVYNLSDLADFAGTYVEGRYGLALGTASTGDLWLENSRGVIMHLRAQREGLMLSLGGDAVAITMKP